MTDAPLLTGGLFRNAKDGSSCLNFFRWLNGSNPGKLRRIGYRNDDDFRMFSSADFLQIKAHQWLAGFNFFILLYKGSKPIAAHLNGIHAYMNQNLKAVF